MDLVRRLLLEIAPSIPALNSSQPVDYVSQQATLQGSLGVLDNAKYMVIMVTWCESIVVARNVCHSPASVISKITFILATISITTAIIMLVIIATSTPIPLFC